MGHRVLVVGDLHLPFGRPGYLRFCKDIFRKWKCNKVIFIGDVVDLHSISFHPKHPDMPSATTELRLAVSEVAKWRRVFPVALVCTGNHDSRPLRLAQTVSIPESLLKDFNEVWGTPGWKWAWEHIIDDVCYIHGTDNGGEHPAFNKMKSTGMSHVLGHLHSQAGIKWLASPKHRVFGMDVGCGIADNSMAFAYAKFARRRSIISCGVVINGIPYLEICPIGKNERYHDSNNT